MVDTAVNFLLENLLQLLRENVNLISGVEDEFNCLSEEVKKLKAFLDDAAKYQSDLNVWKNLVEDIQKTVDRAEDTIDKFLVEAKLHSEKNKVKRFFDAAHAVKVSRLAAEIKDIHRKVKQLREENPDTFQPRPLFEMPVRSGQQDGTQGLFLEDDEVVGFDEEAKVVTKKLVQGPDEIVPVVGMPGLGKTTLARKIYNDPNLAYEFFSIIWVYVGQTYKIKDIFLNILKSFTKLTDKHHNEDVEALPKRISDFINKGGRCLIVLDDVWEAQVIDYVRRVFADKKKGHRIMMTTRQRNLGVYANPEPHDLKFLTKTESFELLKKRVFGKSGSCPDELVGLGESIAKSCDGVPLAVVVIAGALKGRPNRNFWIKVERNVVEHLFSKDNHESCVKFVEMSYDRLPQEVQTCFLYCGIFPRGFDIPSWKLIRLWIAEGLIKSQLTSTIEEIAELHLNDLVNRNLLIMTQKRSDGQIKTCRLHDMLHQFCRKEALNKWLFQEVPPTLDQVTCRRLCIQPSILKDVLVLLEKASVDRVRSFYCFASKQKQIELHANSIKAIYKAFPLIRVLDVESLKFVFTKEFKNLFHLRYIAISGDFKSIPTTFSKFWNLQTLIINTSSTDPILDVKADIWNMLQLRHLHTNVPAKLPSPSATTGKASSLQTLSMVSPESCKKEILAKACDIKKLTIRGKMTSFLETYKGGISNLEELKSLENLKLVNEVDMNEPAHLPPAFFRFVRTLRKLTLANTRFAWSEANRLAQLESLEVLKLKENAFTGDSWTPEIGGFSLLLVLWIERADLVTWEAKMSNFPILRNLTLINCDKLDAVPLGLAEIPNFQEMRLENTGKAVKSAKEIMQRKAPKLKLTIFPPEPETKATQ